MMLQDDLNRLVKRGESLGLYLNISEYCSVSCSQRQSLTSATHYINNLLIAYAGESVRNLGFILTCTICPNKHIIEICLTKFLEFNQRTSREFKLVASLKSLFCALVCLTFEYDMILDTTLSSPLLVS